MAKANPLSRKYYEAIAKILREARDETAGEGQVKQYGEAVVDWVAIKLSHLFKSDNVSFDPVKFLKAAGVVATNPMGPWKSFRQCVRSVSHRKHPPRDPKAYCGAIKSRVERSRNPVIFDESDTGTYIDGAYGESHAISKMRDLLGTVIHAGVPEEVAAHRLEAEDVQEGDEFVNEWFDEATEVLQSVTAPGLVWDWEAGDLVLLEESELEISNPVGVPNLEDMDPDELMSFWQKHQRGRLARELFPKGGEGTRLATADLANAASNLATAKNLRLQGEIDTAISYENIVDSIYDGLPNWAKWDVDEEE